MFVTLRVILCIFRHCRRAFSTVMGVEENELITGIIIITEMVFFSLVMLIGGASGLP